MRYPFGRKLHKDPSVLALEEAMRQNRLSGRAKAHSQKRRLRQQVLGVLYLLPSFVGVMVFFLIPFAVVFFYSLVNDPVNKQFVGVDNFVQVAGNGAFVRAVQNSLIFSSIAVPLAVSLSLLLALVLESRLPFRSQFRSFFLSPMMVPVASVVLIWQVLFHYNGAVNQALISLGGGKIDWMKSSYSYLVIVILFLWKNLGYNMILFMAALANIPRDILEVARLESAGPARIFFTIKLRYLSSAILFVTIMSLINSFKVFREVYLLTGDYPYDTLYMLQHFMNNTFRSLDYQKLSAAAIWMSAAMICLIGVLFLVENHFGRDMEA